MIHVVVGDLAEQEVDAVVRPVRSDLAPVNAVSRDLARRAGEALEERLARMGALPIGGAILTPAGDLSADFLIHVVVMSEDEPQSAFTIRRALENGLRRATDWEIASLALPPLGMGAGTLEAETEARALVEILLDHLDAGEPPLELSIVVASEYEAQILSSVVEWLSTPRDSADE